MSSTTTGVMPGGSTSKIIKLNLSHYRKARVWLGKLPDINYPIAHFMDSTLKAKKSAITEVRRTAVEMLIPQGGLAIYGLLGAEFIPANTEQLVVQVAISGNTEKRINWSLADRIDEVYIGMPLEYASSVLDGVVGAEEILGSGVLQFQSAAHGLVGSSRHIFRQLAGYVVRLLSYKVEPVSEQEIAILFSNL